VITYVAGDLFRSPAKVLVNTVNTVGVMGKGIAKDFKAIYPEMFREYQKLCEEKKIDIGKLYLYRSPHKWVLNFPTKKHWRQPSHPIYIEAGLRSFNEIYSAYGISSIAFPQLGCGHGELSWETQVRPLMERYLGLLPIEVFIHIYQKESVGESVEHKCIDDTKGWLRAEPESLPFDEVWEDLCAILGRNEDFISLDKKIKFSATCIPGPVDGINLQLDKAVFLPKDAWLDAWQNLRNSGFLTQDSLTQGLDVYADEILTILSKLPYLKKTQICSRKEFSSQAFRTALQLVPRAANGTLTSGSVPQVMP